MSLDVSIAIPTLNRGELLRGALGSIQSLTLPEGWHVEIIVIDNASTDDTAVVVEAIRQRGPLPVRLVHERRQGLNHGRNRGLLESRADWIVYLDDDVVVDPGWLMGLADAIEMLAPDCVVGPVDPWFEEPPAAWLTLEIMDSVTSSYARKGDALRMLQSECAHELPGCNFSVRRSVALQAGGFHPSLDRAGTSMLAGGDWEFGLKVARLNKRVGYAPRCKVRHLISRYKTSPEGLRARWEGLGATERAFTMLDDRQVSRSTLMRLRIRMLGARAKSHAFRAAGRDSRAFKYDLEARYIRGYLFGAPHLEPRTWPPVPLASA